MKCSITYAICIQVLIHSNLLVTIESTHLENWRLNETGHGHDEGCGFLETAAKHGFKEGNLKPIFNTAHQLVGKQLEEDVLFDSGRLTGFVVENIGENGGRTDQIVHFQKGSQRRERSDDISGAAAAWAATLA